MLREQITLLRGLPSSLRGHLLGKKINPACINIIEFGSFLAEAGNESTGVNDQFAPR